VRAEPAKRYDVGPQFFKFFGVSDMSLKRREDADAIVLQYATILGPAWKPRIWNNAGWHVAWRNYAMHLHYNADMGKFWAMVGTLDGCGGHMDFGGTGGKYSADPHKAIRHAAERVQEIMRQVWIPMIASVEMILQEYL
jgi:hypothetical protein